MPREAVVKVVAEQAKRFEQMPAIAPAVDHLDERDARLALAIHRTVIQRWITLEYLLELNLKQTVEELEPLMQAVLLTGAAQLVFMERLPPHAVVNESVELARRLVRPGAAGLVNAVLRRTAELVAMRSDEPWQAARDRLPLEQGSIRLSRAVLPPVKDVDDHLAVATSHPKHLVAAWRKQFGDADGQRLLLHSLKNAPLIVHAEEMEPEPRVYVPHAHPSYSVWTGTRAQMLDWMVHSPHRWAQDPTAGKPVEFVRSKLQPEPGVIIDLCAGRGTKTRQLTMAFPTAKVIATDPDAARFRDLSALAAIYRRIKSVEFPRIGEHEGRADLVLLDVPCSNTGVLARRLEARYRYNDASVASLVKLQREIITNAGKLLRPRPIPRNGEQEPAPGLARVPGAGVIYSTCSIEPRENCEQAQWAAKHLNMTVVHDELTLPGGEGSTYHDGGYFALLQANE